tara:strand:+ start:3202 stop:9315 length:6114 start_codon:yes stop_codon:yes gene_type:complete
VAKFVLTAQLQLQAPKNVAQVVQQINNQLKGAKNISLDVGVKGAGRTHQELGKIKSEVDKITSSSDKMGKSFQVSVRRFTALAVATRAVSLFTNTLSSSIKEAISFERELVKISQVTGKTMSNLRDLTNSITGLSKEFGVASSSLLNVSRILSQAGFNAKQTEIALGTLARTELAPTFDDITQTAEGAVAIFNQFRQGAGALEAQLGSVNAVAGKFAVEAGDLISVVRRTGGVFKASGGDLNELIALFTSVRSTTRESADSIATGLRTIFTRIQRPRTIEFLKQYGVELTDLNGKFVGPFEATRKLSAALAGLEQGDISFIKIAEELGGFRQIGKVIPLLQQFSVAQEALNVAQAGSGSLATDAAKAQQTLAVRINTVREEFTALIRSVSETRTFQVMASAALSLAEGLVKVGEAIKPILPLLGALAAFRAIRGFGGMAGNVSRNLQGMKPQGFASGGMVPGSGNGDTVPAMLTPGEFVIKKSSVSKLGASNLAAMNNNRYAAGGQVKVQDGQIGGFFLKPVGGANDKLNIDKTAKLNNINVLTALGLNKGAAAKTGIEENLGNLNSLTLAGTGSRKAGGLNASALTRIAYGDPKVSSNQTSKMADYLKANKIKSLSLDTQLPIAKGVGNNPSETASVRQILSNQNKADLVAGEIASSSRVKGGKSGTSVKINGNISSFYPGGRSSQLNPKIVKTVDDATMLGLKTVVQESSARVFEQFGGGAGPLSLNRRSVKSSANKLAKDENALKTTSGFIFEGLISALTGASFAGKSSRWDFTKGGMEGFSEGLGGFFNKSSASLKALYASDAKRSADTGKKGIIDKIIGDLNSGIFGSGTPYTKMATGGAVGTDTVPALLTPGEFVVNRKSAQSIGYGSLHRMNKVGKYADGGVVQRFGDGTGSKGVTEVSGGKVGAGAKILGASFAVSAALSSIVPPAKETESSLITFSRSLTESINTTIASIGSLGFALSSFGENLSIGQLMKNRFIGPTIAAGGAAVLLTSMLESLTNSTGEFNKAIKDGNKAQAERFATAASTSTARGAGSVAGGALAGYLLGKQFGLLGGAIGALIGAGGAFAGLYLASDSLQNILSLFGAQTAEQVKSFARLKIASNDLDESLHEVSQRAEAMFADAQRSGDFAGASDRLLGRSGGRSKVMERELTRNINSLTPLVSKEQQKKNVDSIDTFVPPFAIAPPAPAFVTEQKRLNAQANMDANNLRSNKIREFFADPENLTGDTDAIIAKLKESVSNLPNASSLSTYITDLQGFYQNQSKIITESQKFINQAFTTAVIRGGAGQFKILEKDLDNIDKMLKRASEIDSNLADPDLGVSQDILDKRADSVNKERLAERKTDLEQELRGVRGQSKGAINKLVDGLLSTGDIGEQLAGVIKRASPQDAQKLLQSFLNINKEVDLLRERFKLLNFGLDQFKSATAASNVALKSYLEGISGSGNTISSSFEVLKTAVSTAAQGISNSDFEKSLQSVSKTLKDYGQDTDKINKVQNKMRAGRAAQSSLTTIIDSLDPNNMGDLRSIGNVQNASSKIGEGLKSGLADEFGPELANRIATTFEDNIGKDSTAETRFKEGGVDVFRDAMTQVTDTLIAELGPAMKIAAENQKIINGLTKTRLAVEKELITAQKQRLDIDLEASLVQQKYNGATVTINDRLKSLKNEINLTTQGISGLSSFQGSPSGMLGDQAGEVRARLNELSNQGELSPKDASDQKRLRDVASQQVSQARKLIQIRELEYQQIKKRSELERKSADALLSGDVDSFFNQQAAQGALKSVAMGLPSSTAFGGDALNEAANFLRELQATGQNTFEGQDIGGAGGLLERVIKAGFEARGLNQSSATQLARQSAETTRPLLDAGNKINKAADVLIKAAAFQEQMLKERVIQAQTVIVNAEKRRDDAIEQAGAEEKRRMEAKAKNEELKMRFPADATPSRQNLLRSTPVTPVATIDVDPFKDVVKDVTKMQSSVAASFEKLSQGIVMKLDTTQVNVNLNGTGMLQALTAEVQAEVMKKVNEKFANLKPAANSIAENTSILNYNA